MRVRVDVLGVLQKCPWGWGANHGQGYRALPNRDRPMIRWEGVGTERAGSKIERRFLRGGTAELSHEARLRSFSETSSSYRSVHSVLHGIVLITVPLCWIVSRAYLCRWDQQWRMTDKWVSPYISFRRLS